MSDYEELLRRVLRIIGEDRRGEVEDEVDRRIAEDPRLTRLGALYIVAGELGVFENLGKAASTIPLSRLVGGLGSVNIEARVVGLSRPRRESPTIYLRLGDSTGVVDAIAWGGAVERLESLNVTVGSAIRVKGAYTRGRPDGSVEVHIGEQAEFSEASPGLPPLEQFFPPLREVFETRGLVDFKAVVLGFSDERRVSVNGEEVGVRDVLLGSGGVKAEMSLWREHVGLIGEHDIGRIAYVAGAKWSPGGTLSTTFRSSIYIPPQPVQEPMLIKIDRKLPQQGMLLGITQDGAERVYSESIEPGQIISVKKMHYRRVGKGWAIIPIEYELVEAEIELRPRIQSIGDLRVGMVDASVKGEVVSKSPATRLKTKKGEADFSSFWLRDESGSIFCKAWGGAVKMLEDVGEGELVTLHFVRIVKNPWGEREVYIGEESLVTPSSDPV